MIPKIVDTTFPLQCPRAAHALRSGEEKHNIRKNQHQSNVCTYVPYSTSGLGLLWMFSTLWRVWALFCFRIGITLFGLENITCQHLRLCFSVQFPFHPCFQNKSLKSTRRRIHRQNRKSRRRKITLEQPLVSTATSTENESCKIPLTRLEQDRTTNDNVILTIWHHNNIIKYLSFLA